MNNQIISIAYSTFINKGSFSLLLGSGISRKSGIPTGWEITLKLISQIAILERQDPGENLEQWYKDYFDKEPDYSDILEKLTNTPEERLNLLRPFIEPTANELEQGLKIPTTAHRQIARLVKDGYIKVIVTTNFDRLIENSLKDLGIEPTVISNPEYIENSIPLVHSRITIIKINGDYLDTKFLNIKSELEEYDTRSVSLLRFIFENYGLITCGWSAQWDLALVHILKSANKFRYSNYFTYINKPAIDLDEINKIKRGQLVKINDADSFFTEYVEDIDALERGNDSHPLSPKIVAQCTKKYLVREEYIIQLHDLLNDIGNDFLLKSDKVNINTYPTLETMREVKDQYLKIIDLLLITIINVSCWSKPYQYNLIMKLLNRVAKYSEDRSTSYVVWGQMVHLPALVLRYACGISCIIGNNFSLLNLMSSLKIKAKYKEESFVIITENYSVIDRDNLNKMNGNDLQLPVSEMLYNFLKPYFSELTPTESEFESAFNYYELTNSLAHIKYTEHDWYPFGRFIYRNNNIIEETLKRIEEEKDDFELVKSGFYSSHVNATLALNKFNDYYKPRRYMYR